MMKYSSLCSSYDYGNAEYWNTRYLEEAGASFDWYQRYSALCPFVRKFVPSSSRILMVGCGNARCIIGDEIDGVPGIQHVAPGFGRKTALKLLKKHGSLANLLSAAAVRTVGKQYVQEALTKHADYLWRNFEVLSLRRNAEVHLKEEWLLERESCNDSTVLSSFKKC